MSHRVEKSEQEWRHELSDEQYRVLRLKGTEPPFSGEYCDTETLGVYHCAACGAELFRSQEKFHSGCGWPSFTAPSGEDAVETETDYSHGMVRIEVMCSNCGSHLGHVFDDGPGPTGQRYCINSVCLDLEKSE